MLGQLKPTSSQYAVQPKLALGVIAAPVPEHVNAENDLISRREILAPVERPFDCKLTLPRSGFKRSNSCADSAPATLPKLAQRPSCTTQDAGLQLSFLLPPLRKNPAQTTSAKEQGNRENGDAPAAACAASPFAREY